jgi:hypothetical protein
VQLSHGGMTKAHEARTAGASVLGAYDNAMGAEQSAAQNIGARSIAGAEMRQEMYRQQAEDMQAKADALEGVRAKRADELNAMRQDFESTSAELAKAKIDPDRRFREMSGGEKALSVFSILLGAVADGAAGKENRALQQFEKQVERDIASQKFAYDAGLNRAEQQRTAYGLAMQKYGQEDAASNVARMSYLDAAKMKIEQAQSMAQSDDARNKFDSMLADIEGKRADIIAKTTAYIQPRATEAQFFDTRSGAILSGSQANAQKLTEYNDARKTGLEIDKGVTLEAAKGRAEGKADKLTDEGAREIAKGMDAIVQARQAAESARQALVAKPVTRGERMMRALPGGEAYLNESDSEAMRREQAWADFSNAAIKATMGNATEGEVKRAMAGIGPNASNEARLATMQRVGAILDAQEKNAMARGSKDAQAEYLSRRANAETQGPGSMSNIPGFKAK